MLAKSLLHKVTYFELEFCRYEYINKLPLQTLIMNLAAANSTARRHNFVPSMHLKRHQTKGNYSRLNDARTTAAHKRMLICKSFQQPTVLSTMLPFNVCRRSRSYNLLYHHAAAVLRMQATILPASLRVNQVVQNPSHHQHGKY